MTCLRGSDNQVSSLSFLIIRANSLYITGKSFLYDKGRCANQPKQAECEDYSPYFQIKYKNQYVNIELKTFRHKTKDFWGVQSNVTASVAMIQKYNQCMNSWLCMHHWLRFDTKTYVRTSKSSEAISTDMTYLKFIIFFLSGLPWLVIVIKSDFSASKQEN